MLHMEEEGVFSSYGSCGGLLTQVFVGFSDYKFPQVFPCQAGHVRGILFFFFQVFPCQAGHAQGHPLFNLFFQVFPCQAGYAQGHPLFNFFFQVFPCQAGYAQGHPLFNFFFQVFPCQAGYARGILSTWSKETHPRQWKIPSIKMGKPTRISNVPSADVKDGRSVFFRRVDSGMVFLGGNNAGKTKQDVRTACAKRNYEIWIQPRGPPPTVDPKTGKVTIALPQRFKKPTNKVVHTEFKNKKDNGGAYGFSSSPGEDISTSSPPGEDNQAVSTSSSPGEDILWTGDRSVI